MDSRMSNVQWTILRAIVAYLLSSGFSVQEIVGQTHDMAVDLMEGDGAIFREVRVITEHDSVRHDITIRPTESGA